MYVYIYLYINIHGDVATLEGSPNIHTYYILIVYTLYINVLIYIFDPLQRRLPDQTRSKTLSRGGREEGASIAVLWS
jgi:hypothetical protein